MTTTAPESTMPTANLFNYRAEQYIVAYMLLNDEVAERCAASLTTHDFTDPFLLEVFKAITEVRQRDRRCAAVLEAVFTRFERHPPVEQHWVVKLGRLIVDFEHLKGSTTYLAHFLRELREATRRRAVQWAAGQVEDAVNFDDPMHRLQELVEEVGTRSTSTDTPPLIGADVLDTLDALDREQRGDRTVRIGSGFSWLDSITGGFARGEVIVLAGGPGQGKTAMALCSTIHNAEQGRSVVYVSLEMSKTELHKRILSNLSGVRLTKIFNATYDKQERRELVVAVNVMAKWKLRIVDTPDMRIDQISELLIAHRMEQGLDLLVIDYMGLVRADNPKASRNEQVSQISRDVKCLARRLEVPVLSLCQFNREGVKGEPKLYHLRDSGSVENDADSVWLMWIDAQDSRSERVELNIDVAKNRRGPQILTKAVFDRPVQRVLAPDAEDNPFNRSLSGEEWK